MPFGVPDNVRPISLRGAPAPGSPEWLAENAAGWSALQERLLTWESLLFVVLAAHLAFAAWYARRRGVGLLPVVLGASLVAMVVAWLGLFPTWWERGESFDPLTGENLDQVAAWLTMLVIALLAAMAGRPQVERCAPPRS